MSTYEKLKEDIKFRILSDIILNNGVNLKIKKEVLVPNGNNLIKNIPNEEAIKIPYSLFYEIVEEAINNEEINFDYYSKQYSATKLGILKYLKKIKDDKEVSCYEKLKQVLNSSLNLYSIPITDQEIDYILYNIYLNARDKQDNEMGYQFNTPITISFLKKNCFNELDYCINIVERRKNIRER